MTKEQLKEQLSIHLVGTIITRAGHHYVLPRADAGVDAIVRQTIQYPHSNKSRLLISGKVIDLQIKCTTESQIERVLGNHLKFDLESKNYNDLVMRRVLQKTARMEPLVLILVVLQEEEKNWVRLNWGETEASFSVCTGAIAYWFFPDRNMKMTQNDSTKRIQIPLKNLVDFKFVETIQAIAL